MQKIKIIKSTFKKWKKLNSIKTKTILEYKWKKNGLKNAVFFGLNNTKTKLHKIQFDITSSILLLPALEILKEGQREYNKNKN